jgi:hypothetical protein
MHCLNIKKTISFCLVADLFQFLKKAFMIVVVGRLKGKIKWWKDQM